MRSTGLSEADAAGARRGVWAWRRAARGVVGGIGLVVLCLAVYLPGLWLIPTVDRDEALFAQASRQMFEAVALDAGSREPGLHDGGVVVPKVGDRPRLNKPPLIYWLQSASAAVCTWGEPGRDAIWMYRLPSVLSAIASVLMTWRIGVGLLDPRAGWLGAALLAVCPMVVWDAHQARADQLLLACTTAAMWGLARIWRRRGRVGWVTSAAMWVAVGLGVLAKGPITPMVVLLTVLALAAVSRRARWMGGLRPLTGAVIVGVMVAAWLVPLAARVGFASYVQIVVDETLGRAAAGREGHSGPPGYHTVLLAALFWPGSMLTAAAVALAVRRARGPAVWGPARSGPLAARVLRRWSGRRGEMFLLAWMAPAWLVFELVSTKLPHYVLPVYPALALVTARGVLAAAAGGMAGLAGVTQRIGLGLWLGLGVAMTVAAPLGLLALGVPGGAWPVVIAGAGCALAALWRARRGLDTGRVGVAQLWGVVAAVAGLGATLGVALPAAGDLWVTLQIERVLADAGLKGTLPVAASGYHEDSLVFATRGRLQRIGDPVEWARGHPGSVVIVPAKGPWDDPSGTGLPGHRDLGVVTGFNYSAGDPVRLRVLRIDP